MEFCEFLKLYNKDNGFMVPPHHIKMARWLQNLYEKGVGGKLLAFRGSGKSTIVGLFCAWVLYKNPNTRIMVVSADNTLATKMVKTVKNIIERFEPLKHLLPTKRGNWTTESFAVERQLVLRDPSMSAVGIMGNATGSRADIIIFDDVEVPNNCDTEQKQQELRTKINEYSFILIPNGMKLFVGTPHTKNSIYL